MRKVLAGAFVIYAVVIAVMAWPNRTAIIDEARALRDAVLPPAPCTDSISYSLGTFDTRFDLSRSQFLAAVAQAASVWNKAGHKTLLAYSPQGSLKINLIYDYRQKATLEMQKLGITIKDDNGTYDSLKAKYTSLTNMYADQKNHLAVEQASYEAAKAVYDQHVAYWNERGGAPEADYTVLQQKREELNTQADAINNDINALNILADQINSTATILNRLASELNLNAQRYNTIGASTGVEFDEGEYVTDAAGAHIDIYQFEDYDKLVRVLAHELGHSLGLVHVSDPKAIMYRLNQGTNETPTAADIAELRSVCHLN